MRHLTDDGAVQVVFYNVDQLMEVKREVMPLVRANSSKRAGTDAYAAFSGRDANAKRTVQVQLLQAASAWTLLHGHAHVWRCTDGSAAVGSGSGITQAGGTAPACGTTRHLLLHHVFCSLSCSTACRATT